MKRKGLSFRFFGRDNGIDDAIFADEYQKAYNSFRLQLGRDPFYHYEFTSIDSMARSAAERIVRQQRSFGNE